MRFSSAASVNPKKPGHWVLTFTCADRPGIVHSVSGAVVHAQGTITESHQFSSSDTGRFFLRMQVKSDTDQATLEMAIADTAAAYNARWRVDIVGRPVRTLILASTAKHCVNHLLFRHHAGQLPVEIVRILSNHESLRELAGFYGVAFESRPITDAEEKAAFERRIVKELDDHDIELVVLARYMQVFSPELCDRLRERAINIHHSFLPGFAGASPYRQAHARGVKLVGATAHFVTKDLDEGPIIEQNVVRVDHSQSPKQLVALGQDEESRTLTQAVRWFAEHRVLLDGARTIIFR